METNCLFASFYGQKWVIPEGQFCTSQWLFFYISERCWKGKCLYPVLALSQQQQHHPAVQAAAQGEDVAHSWSVELCMLPQNEEERQGRWRKGGKDRNPSIPITFHSSARWSWPSKNILTVHLYSFCLGPSLLGGFFSSWNYVYRNACKRLALKKAPFFFFLIPSNWTVTSSVQTLVLFSVPSEPDWCSCKQKLSLSLALCAFDPAYIGMLWKGMLKEYF